MLDPDIFSQGCPWEKETVIRGNIYWALSMVQDCSKCLHLQGSMLFTTLILEMRKQSRDQDTESSLKADPCYSPLHYAFSEAKYWPKDQTRHKNTLLKRFLKINIKILIEKSSKCLYYRNHQKTFVILIRFPNSIWP